MVGYVIFICIFSLGVGACYTTQAPTLRRSRSKTSWTVILVSALLWTRWNSTPTWHNLLWLHSAKRRALWWWDTPLSVRDDVSSIVYQINSATGKKGTRIPIHCYLYSCTVTLILSVRTRAHHKRTHCPRVKTRVHVDMLTGSGDSYSGKSFPGAGTNKFETASGGTILLQNSVVTGIATKLSKSAGKPSNRLYLCFFSFFFSLSF